MLDPETRACGAGSGHNENDSILWKDAMNNDAALRIMLGAILLSVIGIRINYMKSMKLPSQGKPAQGSRNILVPRTIMIIGFSLVIISFVNPGWIKWASLPLPLWLRWCGVCLGIIAVLLLLWVHRSLAENFSPKVRIRQDHTLCTDGLYRWIRHPMYTVLYMLVITWFIVSANWLVGIFWFTVLTGVLAARINKEEAVLLEQFGDQYREYLKHTGRFLPRFKQLKNQRS